MAKIDKMPNKAVIDGFKGVIDFYEYHPFCGSERSITVARKWPTYNASNYPSSARLMCAFFAYISQQSMNVSTDVMAAYEAMAGGTGLTWRDMMVRCYLSKDNL
jgi:hypothetical protein